MSYDIGMEVDTGARYPASVGEWHNYTYNVSQMFRLAFFGDTGINQLHGMTGKVAAPLINKAMTYMREHMDEMRELNPDNGWGNADGALEFLAKIHERALEHPKAVVGVR